MLKRIPLDLITRNPDQPRQIFEPKALAELAASIRQNGLQQPITVRPIEPDGEGHKYQIIMGERRYRAHLLLAEDGGARDIICNVRDMDDRDVHINAIVENLQRAEVSAIEEAYAYHHAIEEFGFTVEELSTRLGIHQPWLIPNRLKLLGLTEANQDLLTKGVISKKQAFHMADLSPNGQTKFLDLCKRGLVNTNAACAQAAASIAAQEAQMEMTMPMPTQIRARASIKSTEDQIDKIGAAISAMLKDGAFTITGDIDMTQAARCEEKIRLLKLNLGQIERELNRAASLTAAAAA